MKLAIVLFDIALFHFFFGHSLVRRLMPAAHRARVQLRDLERHLRGLLRRDRDLMDDAHIERLHQAIDEVSAIRTSGDAEAVADCLARFNERTDLGLKRPGNPWIREHLEILVVALGLAFGVRGLFLQPFKIPTGSMQPTLYGIHFVHVREPIAMNRLERFFQYIHYSRRIVDETVVKAGRLDLRELRPARPAMPFFPATLADVGGVTYRLPGAPDTVAKYVAESAAHLNQGVVFYGEGDVLARGYLELGDHLFVDRTRFCFREPRRGDITVFLTDGISGMGGRSLGGRYYIKRLVGVPGDTIRISDRRLYVKPRGAGEFELMDADDAAGFERIYSFRGGYRGYAHFGHSQFLRLDDDEFVVPDGEYFMLGDNSENSRDSRFWGTVPRRNIVGRALFVWWPFSRRWGLTDRVEPLDYPTPPTPGM